MIFPGDCGVCLVSVCPVLRDSRGVDENKTCIIPARAFGVNRKGSKTWMLQASFSRNFLIYYFHCS